MSKLPLRASSIARCHMFPNTELWGTTGGVARSKVWLGTWSSPSISNKWAALCALRDAVDAEPVGASTDPVGASTEPLGASTVTECPARTSPLAKVRNVSSTPPPIPDPSGPTDVDRKMIRMGVNRTTIRLPTGSRLPTNTNHVEEPMAKHPDDDPSE